MKPTIILTKYDRDITKINNTDNPDIAFLNEVS